MPQYSQTMEMQRTIIGSEFTDAHCHLNLFPDPRATIAEANDNGVTTIIATGGSAKDNVEVVKLSEVMGVFAVIGISPDFSISDSGAVEGLEALVKSGIGVMGIGEIGIDVKIKDLAALELQKQVFERQVDIANSLSIPVVIHSRGALEEIVKTLEKKKVKRAMFHFFDGTEEQAKALAGRGYFISIPPAETAVRKKVIKSISINNIVAETDSPIVGKTPVDTIRVCETIAKLKDMSLEDVAMATTENIRRLFYI